MKVVDEDGKELGIVKQVIQTGANDVYVVKHEDGTELLLPAIRQCVKEVDLESGKLTVYLMPGLREL